jgi:hypothetical protein
MRLFQTFLILFIASLTVVAQTRAGQYVDVVFLHKGKPIEGTVLSYEYNERVVLVKEDGEVQEIPWVDLKRVNFRLDRNQPLEITEDVVEDVVEDEKVIPAPARKFRHQLSSSLTLGNTTNSAFSRTATALGGGFAYHLIRDVSFLTVGAGVDVNLMNHERRENVLAATVIAELPIGNGRIRPFVRLEAGPTFPFGGRPSSEEITSRKVTPLYHPAIGIEITPRNGEWGQMTIDLGYRFLNSQFELTTESLDVVERNVNYRRLTFRGGMRF